MARREITRACERCSVPFTSKCKATRFCSHQCAHTGPPEEVRFAQKVDVRGPGECSVWTASLGRGGYGVFRFRGKWARAHRVAWILANGPIPKGMFVCHRCDNRPCVNPDHLFLGSHQDNTDDMIAKGRNADIRGENNQLSKLTTAIVIAIRAAKGSHRVVAKRFGSSIANVGKIRSRQLWKHVL